MPMPTDPTIGDAVPTAGDRPMFFRSIAMSSRSTQVAGVARFRASALDACVE